MQARKIYNKIKFENGFLLHKTKKPSEHKWSRRISLKNPDSQNSALPRRGSESVLIVFFAFYRLPNRYDYLDFLFSSFYSKSFLDVISLRAPILPPYLRYSVISLTPSLNF